MKGFLKKLVSRKAKLVYVNSFAVYRFAVSGIIVAAWYSGEWNWAVGLLLSGVLSDYIDGFLARLWKVTTKFGFWFDMLSDRFLLMSPFIAETLRGRLPWYILPGLVVLIIVTDILAISSKNVRAPQAIYWFSLFATVYVLLTTETSFIYTLPWLVLWGLMSMIPACEPAKRKEGAQAVEEILGVIPEKYRNQIPNMMSWFRIIIALPCYLLVMGDHWITANIVVTLAWISDMYDGEVARYLGIANPKNPIDVVGDGVFVAPLVFALARKGLISWGLVALVVVLWLAAMIIPEYTKGIIKQIFIRILPLMYIISATYISYTFLNQVVPTVYSLIIIVMAGAIATILKRERLYQLIWQGKRAQYIDLPGNKRTN